MAATKPQLHAFADLDALAPTLRTAILDAQNESISLRGNFKIAVSAGAVPDSLAAALLPKPGRSNDGFQFDKWEVFLADERAVPLDHPDSNYNLLKNTLLDKLPADQRPKVHPIDSKYLDDLPKLASQYEHTLNVVFGTAKPRVLPEFDLLLLGCGPDGHLCSLFPGHPLLQEKDAFVAPIDDSPKPPPRRVTLTLPVVTNARGIIFVVLGPEKQDTLRWILDERASVTGTLVNHAAGGRVRWFADGEALEGVRYPRANA